MKKKRKNKKSFKIHGYIRHIKDLSISPLYDFMIKQPALSAPTSALKKMGRLA